MSSPLREYRSEGRHADARVDGGGAMPLYLDIHNKVEGLTAPGVVRRPRRGSQGPAQVRGELSPVLVRRGHRQGVLPRRGAHQGGRRRRASRGSRPRGGRDHRGQGRRLIPASLRMRCPQCEHENPPGARFCNACGTALAGACRACGHANAAGQPILQRLRAGARPARDRLRLRPVSTPRAPTPLPTSRSASSPAERRSRASASWSRCSSPTRRAPWSSWPTGTPRTRGDSSTPCSSA